MALPQLGPILPFLAERGIVLDPDRQGRIGLLVDLLERWNRAINLTAVRGTLEILVRHVLDSLMLEALGWPGPGLDVVDIGSGAGLPGLLIALLHPDCRVTSVETVAKKISFQTEAARQMDLPNFVPLRQDVFALAQGGPDGGAFDLAVTRAFAELKVLLPLAARLLRPGGRLWAFKGARLPEEEAALDARALEPFEPEVRRYEYRFDTLHWGGVIVVYRKRGGEAL
jgi:16S rRNA (guanine527-N7)-methyltransferase